MNENEPEGLIIAFASVAAILAFIALVISILFGD